jgi:hypothetical protein
LHTNINPDFSTHSSSTADTSWDDPPIVLNLDTPATDDVEFITTIHINNSDTSTDSSSDDLIDLSQPSTSSGRRGTYNKYLNEISYLSSSSEIQSAVQSDGPSDNRHKSQSSHQNSSSSTHASYADTPQESSTENGLNDHEQKSNLAKNGLLVSVKREQELSESDAGSDIMIVGYDKPWEERSPIAVSSPEEEEIELLTTIKHNKHKQKKKSSKKSRRYLEFMFICF